MVKTEEYREEVFVKNQIRIYDHTFSFVFCWYFLLNLNFGTGVVMMMDGC